MYLGSQTVYTRTYTGGAFGGLFAARRGTIKYDFIAALQAGKERFLYLFQIIYYFVIKIWKIMAQYALRACASNVKFFMILDEDPNFEQ